MKFGKVLGVAAVGAFVGAYGAYRLCDEGFKKLTGLSISDSLALLHDDDDDDDFDMDESEYAPHGAHFSMGYPASSFPGAHSRFGGPSLLYTNPFTQRAYRKGVDGVMDFYPTCTCGKTPADEGKEAVAADGKAEKSGKEEKGGEEEPFTAVCHACHERVRQLVEDAPTVAKATIGSVWGTFQDAKYDPMAVRMRFAGKSVAELDKEFDSMFKELYTATSVEEVRKLQSAMYSLVSLYTDDKDYAARLHSLNRCVNSAMYRIGNPAGFEAPEPPASCGRPEEPPVAPKTVRAKKHKKKEETPIKETPATDDKKDGEQGE